MGARTPLDSQATEPASGESPHSPNVEIERQLAEQAQALAEARRALASEIARRREVEQALRASKERLSQIVDHAPIVFFCLDQDGVITLSEGDRLGLLGYKPGEVVGRRPADLFPGVPQVPAFVDRAVSGHEMSMVMDLGGYSWLIQSTPVRAADGSLAGVSGVATDVTEQVRAERALRSILNSAIDGVITIDHRGQITEFNPAAERMFGYQREHALGHDLADLLIPPALRDRHRFGIQRYLDSRTGVVLNQRTELSALHADGREFPVEISIVAIPDTEPPLFTGFIRDITERRRSEERILREKEFSETTIDSLPGVFYLFDAQGRFRRWNKNFEIVSGHNGEEVAHMHPLDFIAEADRSLVAERIREVFETGHASVEAGFMHHSGRALPYFLTGKRLVLDEIICLAGMGVDISERKLAEDELQRRTAELARSNRELEQFAYVASHDLQEPLRAVAGYVELVKQREHLHLPAESREFIDQAIAAVHRMQTLIQDLLSYSRVGITAPSLQADLDSESALQDVLKNLSPTLAQSGAALSHDPLPVVAGDVSQLRQVLQNLLSNAIKFRGGAAPRIHVSAHIDGTRCRFAVQDNGIGFDGRYRDRIFTIFQRLHPRTRYPGTGVGLAICKKIVERHGGEIWAESELGVGSTFYFTWPSARGDNG